ncbi:MAG: hypothetical protein JWP01_345 [Myxococcales bacterium]|nr:hypothetical protein [Myxococcales bacterium]
MNRFVIVGVLLLTTATSFAERATAERYFRAGAKAYASQNFVAAAANFDEAYRSEPMPEIAFSGAQAYRRLYHIDPKIDHVKRAIELYRAYLDKVKTGGRVGDAADNLAEMQRELDKLKAAGVTSSGSATARTRLGISVTLADQRTGESAALTEVGDATGDVTRGLAATIDGTAVEPFALVEVEAKEHVIKVVAEGYFPVEKRTVAVENQSALVEIELAPRPAIVKVMTEGGARISVDGRPVATSPSAPLELAAGKHLLTVLHRGREPFGREITVGRGEQVTVAAPLVNTGRRRAVPWLLGGAGLLAAGAVTTGILATVHDGDATTLRDQLDAGNRPPSDGDRYEAEVRTRDRYVTATWVIGGAAVTVGAVGVLLFLFDHPSTEGVQLTPMVGTSTGLSLGGSF